MRLKISRKSFAACGAVLAVVFLMALAVSCGEPFSSVQITGSPSLYAPLGSRSIAMSEYNIVPRIITTLVDSGVDAYDFTDPAEPNIVKVLLHYPLFEVPLDFDEYMADIDLTGGMEQTIAPVSLTVPALGASSSTSIPISINGPIINGVNAGLATPPQTVVESGSATLITLPEWEIPLTVTGFTSATFSAGTLTFAFNLSGQSSGLVLVLDAIAIEETTGTVIVQATPNLDITQPNASISMSLAGVTLPQNFNLVFTLSTQGGVALPLHEDDLAITPTLSADTAVQGAEGVNFTQNISLPAMTLPLGTDATFVSALIGAGSMTLAIGDPPLPTEWTNITNTFDLLITQGTTTIANLSGVMEPIVVDLAGVTIAAGDISAAATMHVNAAGASVSDVPAAGISLSCDIDTVITDIDSLVIHPATPPVADMTFSQAVDPALAEWVDSIELSNFGLDVTVNNQLPAGCGLSLDVVSPTFSINSLGNAFPVGATTTINISSGAIIFDPSTAGTIQFDVGMNLSGYNEGTGNLTLANVAPGQPYTFSGTITPIIVWSSVHVNPGVAGYSGTFPDTGTMDLSSMTSFLGSGINFDEIPVHLYLSGPESLSINASVLANYGGTSSYLLGTAAGGANIASVAALPNPLSATPGAYNAAIPASSASLTGFAGIINARPADLTLDYDVQSGAMTITPDMLGNALDISMDLIMVLPFEWTVTGSEAPISLEGLPDGTGDDLFGRTSLEGGLNDVLDLLQSMTLGVNINNQTGLNLIATLTAGTGFSKTLDAGTGAHSIVLDATDVAFIRDNFFRPVLSINLPPGAYAFRRDAALTATLNVTAVADIDRTFELGGGSN